MTGWRKHDSHRAEVTAVKRALLLAGINARVGHGRGTAWGWLEINIGAGQQWGEHVNIDPERPGCAASCNRCRQLQAMRILALKIAQAVTGRHGDYSGEINIFTQDHWTDKAGAVPIAHPKWRDVPDPEATSRPEPMPATPAEQYTATMARG